MHSFLTSSGTTSFTKGSNEQQAESNADDVPGGAVPIATVKPPADGAPLEDPHRPWAIPGVGGSF